MLGNEKIMAVRALKMRNGKQVTKNEKMKRKLINGLPKADMVKMVNNAIDETTISSEASTCALMTEALSIMLQDLDDRMRSIYAAHGMITKHEGDSIMSGMARYCKAVRMAMAEYEKSIRGKFEECTFGYGGVQSYDNFRRSCNDVARITMKLCDKGKAEGVMKKIESYINRFKPQGRFTEEDYNRFILR